jgi:hypothetical protein
MDGGRTGARRSFAVPYIQRIPNTQPWQAKDVTHRPVMAGLF